MDKYEEWLYSDVEQNRKIIETNDSQLARRNYLRSLSAFYELILTNLRETTAKLLVDEFDLCGAWNIHEIYPLMDETARLSEHGQIRFDINRLPFIPLVKYTLETYAKQIGFSKEIFADEGWSAFQKSQKIRDRITHPKKQKEIEITDEELLTIEKGWLWWNDVLKQLREAHYKKIVGGQEHMNQY